MFDDATLALPAERGDGGGVESERAARGDWEFQPASGDDPQHITLSQQGNGPVDRESTARNPRPPGFFLDGVVSQVKVFSSRSIS